MAASAGVGIPQAATAVANALNIFPSQATRRCTSPTCSPTLANKSATDVGDLQQAIAQVGTVASQFGLTLEDTAGALALFADAGLKGSDAGTSLKTALTAMLAPTSTGAQKMRELGLTFRDAQGHFVGLATAADQLRAALGPLTQAQRDAALAAIFGQDAIRVGAILYKQGGAAVTEYTAAVNASGRPGTSRRPHAGLERRPRAGVRQRRKRPHRLRGRARPGDRGSRRHPRDGGRCVRPPLAPGAAGHGRRRRLRRRLGADGRLARQGPLVIIGTVGAFKDMVLAMRAGQTAMTLMAAAAGPLSLALTAIATVAVLAIARHREEAKAARDLTAALKDLAAVANTLAKQGLQAQADAAKAFSKGIDGTVEALGKRADALNADAHAMDAKANRDVANINLMNEERRAANFPVRERAERSRRHGGHRRRVGGHGERAGRSVPRHRPVGRRLPEVDRRPHLRAASPPPSSPRASRRWSRSRPTT